MDKKAERAKRRFEILKQKGLNFSNKEVKLPQINRSRIIRPQKTNVSKKPIPIPIPAPPVSQRPQFVPPKLKPSITRLLTEKFYEKDVKISIIIPVYNCKKQVINQIESWQSIPDSEIIYINDACNEYSFTSIIDTWKENVCGKILLSSHRCGYATSCNAGAKVAKGEYLVFLNANTTLTPNWLNPMLDLLKDNVGLVGNLHKINDIITSGEKWRWKAKEFQSDRSDVVGEKEAVAKCMAITRKLFEEVGGFDENYINKGWEDYDLNMKVKEKGYKIFCAKSMINCHPMTSFEEKSNAEYFLKKWFGKVKI